MTSEDFTFSRPYGVERQFQIYLERISQVASTPGLLGSTGVAAVSNAPAR